MQFNKYLDERRSVRDYKESKINKNDLNELMNTAKEIEKEHGNNNIEFLLFEDGEKIYEVLDGIGGYVGVMIRSPHYVGLKIIEDNNESYIRGAYSMELLITRAYEMGLGTCWISINSLSEEDKVKLLGDNSEGIDYLVSIGYPKDRKPFQEVSTSSRLAIEDIVFLNDWNNGADIDELERRGLKDLFYYARFSPSARNIQPWRFLLKDEAVYLAILNPLSKESLTDGGIMMYYFKGLAHDRGITGNWDIYLDDSEKEYTIIGKYKL